MVCLRTSQPGTAWADLKRTMSYPVRSTKRVASPLVCKAQVLLVRALTRWCPYVEKSRRDIQHIFPEGNIFNMGLWYLVVKQSKSDELPVQSCGAFSLTGHLCEAPPTKLVG